MSEQKNTSLPVNDAVFKQALSKYASGVTVITTGNMAEPAGLTVSSFNSLSLEPPLVLFCLDKRSDTVEALQATQAYTVNILRAGQTELALHFAQKGSAKWEGIAYQPGSLGVPRLDEAMVQIECRLHQLLEGGDHWIAVGYVVDVNFVSEDAPLLYYARQFGSFQVQE